MEKYISKKMFKGPKEKGLFEINAMALERERNGEKIIHMEIGRPVFDTPKSIKNAGIEALIKGDVHYTNLRGTDELRLAIAKYIKEKLGMEYEAFDEILVTVGASEALHCIWSSLLNPGDEVLVPSPFYGSYREMITYAYGKLVEVPVIEDGKINYDIKNFEAALSHRTKMILINSPNNPTGYVMVREEMEVIAEFAKKHDLIVISDECYDNYIFEGEYLSIATLPAMKERTLIVNSTSKTFAMTGWRVGFLAGHSNLVDACAKVHGNESVCPSSFAQAGAAYAFGNYIPELNIMREEFLKRKDYIVKVLREYGDITYIEPKGAFYIFLNIEKTGLNAWEFCEELLMQKGVVLSPGTVFGSDWKDYVRISYASSMENIVKSLDAIKEFCNSRIK